MKCRKFSFSESTDESKVMLSHFLVAMTKLGILLLIPLSACFNLSPTPSKTIPKPSYQTHVKQTSSSWFGYSINLRRESLIIGAPRAESTLGGQRKLRETGEIYKCNLSNFWCYVYVFDKDGNTRTDNSWSISEHSSENKNFQLLGGAMDGGGSDSDRFVVCAPNLKAVDYDAYYEERDYMLHGICYWVEDTVGRDLRSVQKITPLRTINLQLYPVLRKYNATFSRYEDDYFYIYGQSGFSVHLSDDQEEIIIGCPGVLNWRGTIIKTQLDQRKPKQSPARATFTNEVMNAYYTYIPNTYFGFAVSSGRFLDRFKNLYVASAPKNRNEIGNVFIFDTEGYEPNKKIKVYKMFTGGQMGEYFGFTLLTEDFNNDGLPDLAVSAPLYRKSSIHDHGAVYVYINQGNVS